MKVVIFGCQQIAVDFLQYLKTCKDVEVPLVVTYELPMDKTYGYKSVIDESRRMGMPVVNPARINEETVRAIKEIQPDIIFSVYYRKIFPQELLTIPRLGCINIHPSMLPKYRGPVPTAWAIYSGDTKAGVTIHCMDTRVDTGDILVQKEFDIEENETGYELYTRTMKIGAELLSSQFYNILHKKLPPRPQAGVGSYYGKLKSKHILDWQQSCTQIKNIVRVYAKPYNSAENVIYNKYILINRVSILQNPTYVLQGAGKVVDILDRDRLVVSCADGFVVLEDYEIAPQLTELEKSIYFKIGTRLESGF